MSLAQEDIEFIKQHLGEWLTEVSLGKPPAVYEIELRERMARVEEALKHQGERFSNLSSKWINALSRWISGLG